MSMVMTSGRSDSARATPSRPSRPCPTTSSCGSELIISCSTLHMNGESSTTSTRILFSPAFAMSVLPQRDAGCEPPLRLFRSDQALDGGDQLIFLHGFGQKSHGAIFHGTVAMLGSGARGHHQNGNASCGGILPQMCH